MTRQKVEKTRPDPIFHRGVDKEDQFSHLCSREVLGGQYLACLNQYNTRGVQPHLIPVIREQVRKCCGDFQLLDSGAGIGNTSYELSQLFPGILIDTIGLTPFSPDFRLKYNYKQLVALVQEWVHEDLSRLNLSWINELLLFYWHLVRWKVDPSIKAFEEFSDDDKKGLIKIAIHRPWGISFKAALELNHLGYPVFEKCLPYVHCQYIGNIRDICEFVFTRYDFIYDYWGAIHYGLKDSKTDEQFQKIANSLRRILKPGGMLYLGIIRANKIKIFKDFKIVQEFKTEDDKIKSLLLIKKN